MHPQQNVAIASDDRLLPESLLQAIFAALTPAVDLVVGCLSLAVPLPATGVKTQIFQS